MGALLPTLQAGHLREGLTDYLATTFALTDPDAQSALTDFVGDPDTGHVQGPLRPAAAAVRSGGDDWREHLDWCEGFTPYGHQAAAFERLSTKREASGPQPTLVTTGTGSGKTEAFLYPDPRPRAARQEVRRHRDEGADPLPDERARQRPGRAARRADRPTHPELAGVTAGLYTGEQTRRPHHG